MKAVIVTYVVKKGMEKEFEKTLRRHWKQLRKENLTTSQPPFLLKDPENPAVYKEIFEWRNQNAMRKAHTSPAIKKIWVQMTDLTEEGGVEPANFQRI